MTRETPTTRKTERVVKPHEAGLSLLEFLCRNFTYLSESQWVDLIEENRLFLNRVRARAKDVLSAGDRLITVFPDLPEPLVRKNFEIVFEDGALVAVDKPGNLPCHPGGRYFENTLWQLLKKRTKLDTLYFVHRIDRETSGVVLVAKTPDIARQVQSLFLTGQVEKRYLAMVFGAFPENAVNATGYLIRDRASPVRKKTRFVQEEKAVGEEIAGKRCATVFRRICHGMGVSLVEACLKTGRRHQIRATLLSLGFPVVGDKLYGPDDTIFLRFISDRMTEEDRRALRLERQALHCSEIGFRHPVSGKEKLFKAPYPRDWPGDFAEKTL